MTFNAMFLSPLHACDVSAMEPGALRQFFLREVEARPEAPDRRFERTINDSVGIARFQICSVKQCWNRLRVTIARVSWRPEPQNRRKPRSWSRWELDQCLSRRDPLRSYPFSYPTFNNRSVQQETVPKARSNNAGAGF